MESQPINISPGIPRVENAVSADLHQNASSNTICAWTVGATDGLEPAPYNSGVENNNKLGYLPKQILDNNITRHTEINSKIPTGKRTTLLRHPSASKEAGTTLSALSKPRKDTNLPMNRYQSFYEAKLLNQTTQEVEAVLSSSCEAIGFDIAEMWLRTGAKTHRLANSHLRPAALDETVREKIVDVYYGKRSSERTHRLSPALCKRAKEAMDVVWVTANTEDGAKVLQESLSDVRTAVAVPVCHETSNTNITLIYFSIRRAVIRPTAVEFLVHMSLATAVASVNSLANDVMIDHVLPLSKQSKISNITSSNALSQSEHSGNLTSQSQHSRNSEVTGGVRHSHGISLSRPAFNDALSTKIERKVSVTGANLNLKWSDLNSVEYLTDGGHNWIHTAVMNGKSLVIKTLKPECQDLSLAMNEIEEELDIHSKLNHENIVELFGAGRTHKGNLFLVLERLDGGTLSQTLGYGTRIRDRRKRFWNRKRMSFVELLKCAKSIADAMKYCHGDAIEGCSVMHRDLKPDNIGFTLNGTVKLIDFGLSKILRNSSPDSDEMYEMTGETGSLRYMAPEVADARPYNHKADVYSYGMILWELLAAEKPFNNLSREQFYEQVVHGGERPHLNRKKWPEEIVQLISNCWSFEPEVRPNFSEVVLKLDAVLKKQKGGGEKKRSISIKRMITDRHSTWF